MQPTEHIFSVTTEAGSIPMAYTKFSPNDSSTYKPLLCVHGLTRNGRDFDYIASALCRHEKYTVYCPDIIGRNKSGNLPEDKAQLYNYTTYTSNVSSFIQYILQDEKSIDYIGTSMGGIIGMMIASAPSNPIRALVLNDIGPVLKKNALSRIKKSLSEFEHSSFTSQQDALEKYCKIRYVDFGITDDHWDYFTSISVKQKEDGLLGVNYDTNIKQSFSVPDEDVQMWTLWDAINCPVLLIRGKNSDIIDEECVKQMKTRGPSDFTVIELDHVGHAPSLYTSDQIKIVREWLKEKVK
ncbi:lipase [Acrasis kona]|uniref:Lipase n=1 Tax=Acrasis kona TaxID=1008807 RepID=A0AAW2Z4A4_9EUKA